MNQDQYRDKENKSNWNDCVDKSYPHESPFFSAKYRAHGIVLVKVRQKKII